MGKNCVLMFVLGFLCCSVTLRTRAADNKIRNYPFPMDPRQHPDDNRRSVKPPDAAIFGKELGDHWFGMDNGEQDGRYVGGFASQLVPLASSRERQYLNFQNHFLGLTDQPGNKMSTLVLLNFGHYFLKEMVYTLIGAETAQGLPNGQVYYSFIRGAGKQYGVPWFGNASVWNRWGWKNYSGKNTAKTIAGGDIRIFIIKMEEHNIGEIPFIQPTPNPVNRGLNLRNISSIEEEILLRPTFFQHFDQVVIDWKYLLEKEKPILANESGWMKRQGLKLMVDFSSGINLFPDLRLVNNDSPEYLKSLDAIKSVIDKMVLTGENDLIMNTHRSIENNFTSKQFDESMNTTIKEICHYATKYKINVNLRISLGRNGYGTLWNINKPVKSFCDKKTLKQLLQTRPESALIMDGLYNGPDAEYSDIHTIETL